MNRCMRITGRIISRNTNYGEFQNLTASSTIILRKNHVLKSVSLGFHFRRFSVDAKVSLTSGCSRVVTPFHLSNIPQLAHFSTRRRVKNGDTRTNHDDSSKKSHSSEDIDDLTALWKDKSLSLTAKCKVLFQQYGVVLVVVYLMTVVFWMSLFYLIVSWGFDVTSFLEAHGVFDFLERIGLPASEKLKSPGASNLLSAYLLYELAKPIRLPVIFFSTVYAVRFLRRFKYLKPPPKADATVRELVSTRRKIARHQLKTTTTKYRDRYNASQLKLRNRLRRNGHSNGKSKNR